MSEREEVPLCADCDHDETQHRGPNGECVLCPEMSPCEGFCGIRRSPAPSVREERAGEGLEVERVAADAYVRHKQPGLPWEMLGEKNRAFLVAMVRAGMLAARAEPVAAGTSATPVAWMAERIVDELDRARLDVKSLGGRARFTRALRIECVERTLASHPVPVAAGEPSEAMVEAAVKHVPTFDADVLRRLKPEEVQWHKRECATRMLRAALGARKEGG